MPSGELYASYIVSVYNNITQFLSSNFPSSVRPLAVDLAYKFSSVFWLYKLSAANNFLKRCIFTQSAILCLTLTLLKRRIWWVPNNASRWQMGFNLAFKGLILVFSISVPPNRLSTQNLCNVNQDDSQLKQQHSKLKKEILRGFWFPAAFRRITDFVLRRISP